jgi:hypothetical protein
MIKSNSSKKLYKHPSFLMIMIEIIQIKIQIKIQYQIITQFQILITMKRQKKLK